MRTITLVSSLALFAALVLGSSTASAASAPASDATAKRFRLSIETEVFGFAHADGTNFVGFGIGRVPLDESFALLGPQLVAIGFAYLFPNQQALLGARAGFSLFALPDDGTTYVSGRLIPYFQWIFSPGKPIRPYVEFHFGFSGGRNGDSDVAFHAIAPIVGAGGGAHFFLVDAVSIDLGLNLDYIAPHARATGGFLDSGWSKAADAVQINALLGLSAWF